MSMAGDEPEHVVVVPGGLLAPSAQAGPARCYAEGQPEGQAQVRRPGRRVHGHADRRLISCVAPGRSGQVLGGDREVAAGPAVAVTGAVPAELAGLSASSSAFWRWRWRGRR